MALLFTDLYSWCRVNHVLEVFFIYLKPVSPKCFRLDMIVRLNIELNNTYGCVTTIDYEWNVVA